MVFQCLLCAQSADYIGVGECNHTPICYRCVYKMRVISKNNSCPICKTALKRIIISDRQAPFAALTQNLIPDKQFADVFHTSPQAMQEFQKLTEQKCWVKINGKPCKHDKKFPSIAFLKKHLKQEHNRYLCDICCDKKTCVLQQQKLYTFKALQRHMERGDMDEFGNVTFMHPYCKFCNRYFFDEDQFRVHINLQHITCNVCGKQEKYRYYKNYDSLQIHYKMSHYICTEEVCLEQKFMAFATAQELKLHRIQVHDRNLGKKIDMKQLCGFQYEGHNHNDDHIIVIKDKEGVDMEDQFLNLKKCKNKALGEADMQNDQLLDPRVFYLSDMAEDEHFQQAFVLRNRKNDGDRPQTEQNKKKKYVEKGQVEKQRQKEKPRIAKENEFFYLQDLPLIYTLYLPKIGYEQLQSRLKSFLSTQEIAKMSALKSKFMKKQLTASDFFTQLQRLLKPVSLRSFYLIFPHLIRTFVNEDVKNDLEYEYVCSLKQLQTKHDNLIMRSKQYTDLFGKFLQELEKNIEQRIRNGKLSLKKPVKRSKERLYQIMGVVRRLKIQEMAKFKFSANFGVQKDTIDYLVDKVMKGEVTKIQQRLDKVDTEELLDVYVFSRFCLQAIKHSKNMQMQKTKINQNILENFLYQRPDLEKQFGLKREQLKNLQEQVQFQKMEEEKKIAKTLKELQMKNKKQGILVHTDFNLKDKSDFPELVSEKKPAQKEQSGRLQEVMSMVKQKPATYQKKINELFPSLGDEDPGPAPKVEVKVQVKKEPQEKAWWEKINQKKEIFEEQEEVKVRQGKKRKEKWVSVKGIFN